MPHGRQARLFNFLAIVFLSLSILSLGWEVNIAMNPYGRLNPFPPPTLYPTPTLVAAVVFSTVVPNAATATPMVEPSAAPTPTLTEAPTRASAPTTSTATVTAKATVPLTAAPTLSPTLLPTVTPSPSPTRSAFTYTASITYQVHPVQVCDWMGVGGTVTDLSGKAALGSYVHVWGLDNVDQVVAVGGSAHYGPSGWELRLARAQLVGNWTVQLVASPDTQMPLSTAYTISMPGDCKRNLALVRFQQNH